MFYSVVKVGCVLVMSVRKPLISFLIAGNISIINGLVHVEGDLVHILADLGKLDE